MNIKLEQVKDGWWRADCTDLPGSPPCGDGQTKEMAVACLFYRLIQTNTSYHMVPNEILTINGEMWKSPYPYDR